MERVPDNPFPFDVFVDYAHTDDALKNALGMLKKIARGRVLAVFGCGGNRDRGKRPKMTDAVQRLADFAWATSDNPRKEPLEQIFADMKAGVSAPERIVFEPDRRRAIALALDAARAGDCVLIAGKGHETYQEFADITLPFDDKETARELLALTGYVHGGCSPVGMKKHFATFFDASGQAAETLTVSAGRRGFQIELPPETLRSFVLGQFADLCA